jgi:hypothetical protein
VSPLAGRQWAPGIRIASNVTASSDPVAMGLADNGDAVVAYTTGRTATPTTGPFVVHGKPGSGSSPSAWTPPRFLSTFGMRSGGPVPSNIEVTHLQVAPSGQAVMLATGACAASPGSAGSAARGSQCLHFAMYDPVRDAWSPFETDAEFTGSAVPSLPSQVVMNTRGDIALAGVTSSSAWVRWRDSDGSAFREARTALGNLRYAPANVSLHLDASGRMALLATVVRNRTSGTGTEGAVLAATGSVALGLGSPTVLATNADGAPAPGSLRAWSGSGGAIYAVWTRGSAPSLTSRTLFAAKADSALSPFVVHSLPDELRTPLTGVTAAPHLGVVDDAGTWHYYPERPAGSGNAESVLCDRWTWTIATVMSLAVPEGRCILGPGMLGTAVSRAGHALTVFGSTGHWTSFDPVLGRQVQALPPDQTDPAGMVLGAPATPVRMGTPTPVHAAGTKAPISGDSTSRLALSTSGVGLLVFTADLTRLPSPSQPAGVVGSTQLWAVYLR